WSSHEWHTITVTPRCEVAIAGIAAYTCLRCDRASKGDGRAVLELGRSSFEAPPAEEAGEAPQDDGSGSVPLVGAELCRPRRPGCKTAIKRVALGCHVDEQLGWRKARPVFPFQPLAKLDEALGSHHVDVRQRA